MYSLNLTTLFFNEHKQKANSKALRVRAVGNRSGWYFILTDSERNVIARSIGELPAYYSNLEWTDETATLYALIQASRYIQQNFPRHHVALVCATPNAPVVQRREARRTWAA